MKFAICPDLINSIGEIIKTVASNLLRRDVVNIDTFEGT